MSAEQNATKKTFRWIIAIGIVLTAAIFVVVYVLMWHHTVNRYFSLALSSAYMAASIVDGDRIEGYLLDGADDSYYAAADLLRELKIANNLEFLYIVRPDAYGNIFYIFDIRLDEGGYPLGEPIGEDAVDEVDFNTVYLTGQSTNTAIITRSVWGHLVSAYVPVFSSDGQVVAVACADVDMATVIGAARWQTFILFLIFCPILFFIFIIYKKEFEKGQKLALERERVMTELDVARNIQMRMLPSFAHPTISGRKDFDIYACMISKKEIGGDFYDVFFVDDNMLAVVIGKVSGKSVSAALLMSSTMMLIRNSARMAEKVPHKVFEAVNDILCDTTEENVAVTAFMGYLDLANGELTYVNAGYNPPLIKKDGGEYGFMKIEPSYALANAKSRQFEKNTISLSADDTLCLYTDSVVDAVNNEGELFLNQGLLGAANSYKGQTAKGTIEAIQDSLSKFTAGAEQMDDIAMLALRFVGNK